MITVQERRMPESFTDLLGNFAQVYDEEPAPETFDEYVRWRVKQSYPLLDDSATKARRTIPIQTNTDSKLGKSIIERFIGDYLSCIGLSMTLTECKFAERSTKHLHSWINRADLRVRRPKAKKYKHHEDFYVNSRIDRSKLPKLPTMCLNVPLFAITGKKAYQTTTYVEGRHNLNFEACFGAKEEDERTSLSLKEMHFKMPVKIKIPTPVSPEDVKAFLPAAIATYYQAVGEATARLRVQTPTVPAVETEVLWVPAANTMQIEPLKPPRPYKDPALIMKCGEDRYIVGLWDDDQKEVGDIESVIREWSSGSFKKIRR